MPKVFEIKLLVAQIVSKNVYVEKLQVNGINNFAMIPQAMPKEAV